MRGLNTEERRIMSLIAFGADEGYLFSDSEEDISRRLYIRGLALYEDPGSHSEHVEWFATPLGRLILAAHSGLP